MAKKFQAPKIEIRQRKGSRGITTGCNVELYIDGKKITNATKVSFEVASNTVARVNVELIGELTFVGRIGKYTRIASKIQTE